MLICHLSVTSTDGSGGEGREGGQRSEAFSGHPREVIFPLLAEGLLSGKRP